ncbi:MAG: hypothetical protein A3K19_12605 [Lentisphaerae bacterium RIFOXYB12_FULL_65_16]|nr:MAG: hypothetical protein A3K18_12070 [Lentisphaerae bacterium RIFOXYA12_64_32]OGV88124.1 MAG: hypothetical protein A3K19_12605 [Lentisphaerae bacterium RIFOXYB12_FULL_65_16]
MRIVDCHVHTVDGITDAAAILNAMDRNGLTRMLVMSKLERNSLQQTRRNLLDTKKLCDAAPDRLSGLAWLEPTLPGMGGLAREALCDLDFAGIKIIPDHWYATEPRLEPWWELMHELKAGILFHTGILYGHEDGSRFCQPVYLEKLLHYPNIRFAMAHISWPWCDECLAVMGRMRAVGNPQWQSYIDMTPGTPAYIRKQAIANAISFCGVERLMFGSDSVIPSDLKHQGELVKRDGALFDELGLSAAQKERLFSGTAEELFPPRG